MEKVEYERWMVVSLLCLALVTWVGRSLGQGIDAGTGEFLSERVPSLVEIMERLEKEGEEEDLEEAMEWAREIRDEYREMSEEFDDGWAGLHVALAENEAAIRLLRGKAEGDEIDEGEGWKQLRELLKDQFVIRNKIEREEVRRLRREAAEIEEEIVWREEHLEEAIAEAIEEMFHDDDDEDDEEELDEEALTAPIYVPAQSGVPDRNAVLAGVRFDFDRHIAPTLERYCFDCHDGESAKGDLDLELALTRSPLVRDKDLWDNVAERIRSGDMPPEDEAQPEEEDRLNLRAWLVQEIDDFDYAAVRNPGYLPVRRLTREEYNRTIRDLVGRDLRPADAFPMDFTGTSGFSNSGNTLFLQTAHLERYLTSAENVVDAVQSASGEAWEALTRGEDARAVLARFLLRAFRRPPLENEIEDALGRYEKASAAGNSHLDALAEAFKYVLIAPQFLLRIEASAEPGVDQRVGAYDLAARLSYFLWASTPDGALLAAAARGDLEDATLRRAQIDRMLADPRSLALGEIFAGEWLRTDDVGPRIRKDPIDNPWCTESLMAAMRNETAFFFHSLVADNAPVARLINADYTFLNAELATFYRIDGVDGEEMQRVVLDTDQRGGLFGHAAVLATTSFPDRTSPVVRGTWVLDTLLGTPPPPPPPNVPDLEEAGRKEGERRRRLSLRQKLEVHRASRRCAGCHDQIDPLGLALENYANFGQWRERVDSRGTLPNGARIRGPEGLKRALVDSRLDDLGTQLIRKMLAYALGRQLEYYDEGVVREMAAKWKPFGYPVRDLVVEIAECYPFSYRRIPAKSELTRTRND